MQSQLRSMEPVAFKSRRGGANQRLRTPSLIDGFSPDLLAGENQRRF
jgi:hypothetical protein